MQMKEIDFTFFFFLHNSNEDIEADFQMYHVKATGKIVLVSHCILIFWHKYTVGFKVIVSWPVSMI